MYMYIPLSIPMLPRKKTEYAHHPTIIWEISQVIVSLLVEEKTIYFGFAHKRDRKKKLNKATMVSPVKCLSLWNLIKHRYIIDISTYTINTKYRYI